MDVNIVKSKREKIIMNKNDDLIYRQDVINVLATMQGLCTSKTALIHNSKIWQQIKELPSAQSEERPIDYQDCSNALLRMWMDNVVTDGEYWRIMDKLNGHYGVEEDG